MRLSREQYLLSRRRFRSVMDYLDRHLDDDEIRLETLAEVAHLSRFHFERMYVAKVKESPMATVRRLRLRRAKQLLLDGGVPSITQLAVQSGYGSVAAFSRAFSRAFNEPPTAVVSVGRPLCAEPAFAIVQLEALPIVYHPFTGRAADVFPAGDEFSWNLAACNLPWRHWSVHPDGWVDPVLHPDTWVRMWHCAPTGSWSEAIPGVVRGFLPPGSYARFVFVGSPVIELAKLMTRVEADSLWQLNDGPMLRHFPNLPHYTPISERITHLYISVERR